MPQNKQHWKMPNNQPIRFVFLRKICRFAVASKNSRICEIFEDSMGRDEIKQAQKENSITFILKPEVYQLLKIS